MDNLERRFQSSAIRTEQKGTKRYLKGTAILYNSRSVDLGGWKERILPGAASKTLESSDLRFLYDHNTANLLGRESSGTLEVTENARGVHFRVELPQTSVADDVFELCSRGDLTGCSFAMRVVTDSWVDEEDDDDEPDLDPDDKRSGTIPVRLVSQLSLIELSCVGFPAYQETSVSAAERSKILFPDGIPTRLERELRSRSSSRSHSSPAVSAERLRQRAAKALAELDGPSPERVLLRARMALLDSMTIR